jgi:hypothetical protein
MNQAYGTVRHHSHSRPHCTRVVVLLATALFVVVATIPIVLVFSRLCRGFILLSSVNPTYVSNDMVLKEWS